MRFKHNVGRILLAILCFLCIAGPEAGAQLAKEPAAIDQRSYAVTENDMRSYQIIYESFNKKDYAAYSEVIREKIKDRLRKNYTRYYKEGEVNIFFVLSIDGALIKLDIDSGNSTSDKALIDMATQSVKQASPFPHFPKTLPLSQMSFDIKISFRAA